MTNVEGLKEIVIPVTDQIWWIKNGGVALAYDKDAKFYDAAYTWEAAQTLSNEGYRVIAIANDGNMEKEEIQRICNYELSVAIDCFGQDHLK